MRVFWWFPIGRLLLAGCMAVGLAGCIPAPYGPYYRPSYPDPSSQVRKAFCGGQAGPPSKLQFSAPGGIKVAVDADKEFLERSRRDRPLHIMLRVPGDKAFQFLSDQVLVSNKLADAGSVLTPDLLVIYSVDLLPDAWVDFDALGAIPVEAARQNAGRSEEGGFGSVSFPIGEFKDFVPSNLRLTLPSIQLRDGSRLTLPPVDMRMVAPKKGDWVTRYRSAEYESLLQERFTTCKQRTPDRNCDAIPLLDPYGFLRKAGGFSMKTRLWTTERQGAPVLRYDTEMAFNTTTSWRLPDPALHFMDIDSGAARDATPAKMHVLWRHIVPLSTPVRVSPAVGAREIVLHIDSSLGEGGISHYFVQLPPFLLDGERYEFKPIELELRLFDGGIEPFNC